MKIGIGADHGGFDMKQELAKRLKKEGHQVIDFGNKRYDTSDDYTDFAVPVAQAVASGEVERGVLVCGSGVGASVAANKVPGVRAALCHADFSAQQGVEDDDLPGRPNHGYRSGLGLPLQFSRAQFSGADRHQRRLAKLRQLENQFGPGAACQSKTGD